MSDALAVQMGALASVREDWAGHHFETFLLAEASLRSEEEVLRADLVRLAARLRAAREAG